MNNESKIISRCPWCDEIPTLKYFENTGWLILCLNKNCYVRPHVPIFPSFKQDSTLYEKKEDVINVWNRRA